MRPRNNKKVFGKYRNRNSCLLTSRVKIIFALLCDVLVSAVLLPRITVVPIRAMVLCPIIKVKVSI